MVRSRWPITAEYPDTYRQFPVLVGGPGMAT